MLKYMAGMVFMNTHLKGVLVFIGFPDLDSLFIVDIWYDAQKGSGYTLSPMSCQIFSVSPSSIDIVDL